MKEVILILFVFILIIALVIRLQIYLSKKENKYLGLILPVISLLHSLFVALWMDAYDSIGDKAQNILSIIMTFLVSNIPTIVLMTIYLGIREKIKIQSRIDKMNINDL